MCGQPPAPKKGRGCPQIHRCQCKRRRTTDVLQNPVNSECYRQIVDFEAKLVVPRLAEERRGAAGFRFLAELSPEARAPLLKSDADYLRAVFGALEAQNGSVMSFIETQLGVDEAMLDRIRGHLLH